MNDKQLIIEKDRALLIKLGGPSRVAEMLGFDKKKGGVQCVQNWMRRGIPPKQKIERPDLFLGDLIDHPTEEINHTRRKGDIKKGQA